MTTRTKAVGCLLLLAASAFLGLMAARPSEPAYNGTPLSFWVARYQAEAHDGPVDNETLDALRAIGTNAFPFLLKWGSYIPPAWPRQLHGRVPNAAASAVDSAVDRLLGAYSRAERSDAAIFAFSAFRTNADIVIPELTRLMKDHASAIEALGRFGAQGLPPLLTAWSNSTNPNERWSIDYAVLQNLTLDARNTNLVPLLLDTMNRSAQSTHAAASNALFRIAPEIATNTAAK